MEISELEILRLDAEQFPINIFIVCVLFMIGNLSIVLINKSKKEPNNFITLISMLLLLSPSLLMHEYGGKQISIWFLFVNIIYVYVFCFFQPHINNINKK